LTTANQSARFLLWITFSSLMRKFSLFPRRQTLRMTDCTSHAKEGCHGGTAVAYTCNLFFSQTLMVSVEVSKLGCTEMIFVEPGGTINGQYYWYVLLSKRLPAMRCMSGMFVFQRIVHVKRSTYCVAALLTLLLRTCGRPTHPTSIQSTIQSGL